MKHTRFGILSFLCGVWSCGGTTAAANAPESSTAAVDHGASTLVAPAAAESAAPGPTEPPPPKARSVFTVSEGLLVPESVLYDAERDRYLVSNINGDPTVADNNGFISEITPDGKMGRAKFIAAGGKTKLNAPKGSGIYKTTFYVTDINVVRKFDVQTGAPLGDVTLPGATFLNDIAIDNSGKVYVTDSGLKAGAKGLESNGADAVFVIDNNKVRTIAKSKDLGSPNGIAFADRGLVVVTFNGDTVYRLGLDGAISDRTQLPGGGLDGLVAVGDNVLISSWQSSSVYKGKLGGVFDVAIPGAKSPADIGYDSKRNRVLVPHFTENSVEVFELP